MPLSSEDNLRLNVLMAQKVKAIRIDEGKMIIYALTTKGDARIQLNANEKNDRYLKQVKDFLSTKVLGIAGGFPVYISHWNRLGEAKGDNLDKLLLLGEDSAIVAVVNSRELTEDLATSAWWAYQSADNARSMLKNSVIVEAEIGKQLAQFLLEFLPFEEDPNNMLEGVRLILQDDLISEEDKLSLWKKAKAKNTLYLGFLDTLPNNIPEPLAAHNDYQQISKNLSTLLDNGNIYAKSLCQLLSSSGQTFIHTAQLAFKRPPNQIVYAALIESIRRYSMPLQANTLYAYSLGLRTNQEIETDIHEIVKCGETFFSQKENQEKDIEVETGGNLYQLNEVLLALPQLKQQFLAIVILSQISQSVTFPIFSKSDAQGTLMRKKLKHITDEVIFRLKKLQNFKLQIKEDV